MSATIACSGADADGGCGDRFPGDGVLVGDDGGDALDPVNREDLISQFDERNEARLRSEGLAFRQA